MTPRTRLYESQSATRLRARIESEEEITTEFADNDPDWSAPWAEGPFAAFEPEEIEVLDLDEIRDELRVISGRA